MSTTITVLHNQSLLDVAIQWTGNIVNAFEIAKANNISITEQLSAGTALVIPDSITADFSVLSYYQSKYKKPIEPATEITNLLDDTETPQLEGIGYWIIGDDNIVS